MFYVEIRSTASTVRTASRCKTILPKPPSSPLELLGRLLWRREALGMRFELVRKKTVGAGSTALEAGWSELQIVLRYAKKSRQ